MPEMISGIEDDSKCRRGTLLCAPHVGGLKSYQQLLKKTKASVEAGGHREGIPPCRVGQSGRALCQ